MTERAQGASDVRDKGQGHEEHKECGVAAKEDSHGQTAVAMQDQSLVLSALSKDRRLPEVGETMTGQARGASYTSNKGW